MKLLTCAITGIFNLEQYNSKINRRERGDRRGEIGLRNLGALCDLCGKEYLQLKMPRTDLCDFAGRVMSFVSFMRHY